jgi:hypothetical protein
MIVPPVTDPDFPHPAAARRKEGSVPAEEPFLREGFLVFLGGVQHQLDNTFNMAVSRGECSYVESKSAGYRRAYLFHVEDFSLDLARFKDVLGQGAEDGFFPQTEAQGFHSANKSPLPVPDGRKLVCKPLLIPAELGPIVSFVDVQRYSPRLLRT